MQEHVGRGPEVQPQRVHRVQLEIASSNFPRFDRNTQTGEAVAHERLERNVPAINRVYHDALHPSHLRLPVINRT